MNQFNAKILDARKRQHRFIFNIILMLFFLCFFIIISYFFIVSKKVKINPYVDTYYLEIINGKGLFLFKRVLFLSDNITIKVVSEGYDVFQNNFIKNETRNIDINLIEKDTNLTFQTNTEIGQNNWYLDDKLISNEKILNLKVKPGNYKLKIENKFYKSKTLDLFFKKDINKKDFEIRLDRVKAKVNIITEPSGANVFINDKKVGQSPLNYELLADNYEIKLEKKGYQAIIENIELNKLNSILNKKYIFTPDNVMIKLNLEPDNGKLFINGILETNYTGLTLSTKKKYNFVYKKDGYITKEKEYYFTENKNKTVNISLKEEYGEISIITNPIAKILIGGKDFGISPKKIKLQTVNHKLKVIKKGYNTFITTVKTKPNELSKIDIKLEKKIDNLSRKSDENYTSYIGLKLKLFSPNKFIMGAPRHEKGQRANEFLKEIILRKKFYASLTEVTKEQFYKSKSMVYNKKDKNLPISNISWFEAVIFCNWLSEKEGLKKVYMFNNKNYLGANFQNNGYRLPTEAEWEWLARKSGRNNSTKFSWGKNLPIPKMVGNLADESVIGFQELYIPNYKDNFQSLAPVGSFNKDISGLFDLTGNVKEWVHDYYLVSVPKSNMVYYDPTGPKKGVGHVIKGSSYLSATLHEIRASYRDSEVGKKEDIGFRIVRYLLGEEFKNNEK